MVQHDACSWIKDPEYSDESVCVQALEINKEMDLALRLIQREMVGAVVHEYHRFLTQCQHYP